MAKFLVTYMGSEAFADAPAWSREQEQAFMKAWGDWAQIHKGEIVEGGAPIGRTKLVNKGGISDTRNEITGFTIVSAESHEDAAAMFADHPHVTLIEGTSIEVMACLDIPDV